MSLSLSEAQYAKARQTGIAAPMEIDLPQTELSLATGIMDMNTQQAGTLQVAVNPKTDALADPTSEPDLPLSGIDAAQSEPLRAALQSFFAY